MEHDSKNCFTIVLKKEEGEIDKELEVCTLGNELNSNPFFFLEKLLKSGEISSKIPFQVFEVILHQLLRQRHLSSFINYNPILVKDKEQTNR